MSFEFPTTQDARNFQGQTIEGFGRCIFCGSDGETIGLFPEHVIPYSLGGNAQIRDATCKKCEGLTSYIDGYLANGIYRDFRIHARLQSRSGTTKKTKALEATFLRNGVEQTATVPVEHHPHAVALPKLIDPGMLRKEPPEPQFRYEGVHHLYHIPDGFKHAVGIGDDEEISVKHDIRVHLPPFARAIAKIGFCHAVWILGLDGFDHLDLPELIRGAYEFPSFYVGGVREIPPRTPYRLHEIGLNEEPFEGRTLLVAYVRLFSSFGAADTGMPIYKAVVGALKA